jgi:NADPH:quinone reductase-like Zn-dependent oxidoreductase
VGSKRHQQDLVRAVVHTGVRPVLDRAFRLDELAAAFPHQASGARVGKITVDLSAG